MRTSFPYLVNTLIIGLMALGLSACSDEDVDELCVNPLSTGGSPDITATITYTDNADAPLPSNTATSSQAIKVLVPVDAETRSVTLGFAQAGTITVPGAFIQADTVDRIIDGTSETVTISTTAPVAAGSYYPVLILCVDTAAVVGADPTKCNPLGVQSVGYVEDASDVVATTNYARVIVTDPDPAAPVFVDPAVDATFARNSCVGISTLTVL